MKSSFVAFWMICTWSFLLLPACFDQIRCFLQPPKRWQSMLTKLGWFRLMPTNELSFSSSLTCSLLSRIIFGTTWILAKYSICDLETDNLRLTIGGERNLEWSTWKSSIQQSLSTTQTMLDGSLQELNLIAKLKIITN